MSKFLGEKNEAPCDDAASDFECGRSRSITKGFLPTIKIVNLGSSRVSKSPAKLGRGSRIYPRREHGHPTLAAIALLTTVDVAISFSP